MVVGPAIFSEKALIAARGDYGKVSHGHRAQCAAGVRVFNANLPQRTVRLCADGMDVATQSQNGGGNPCTPQQLCRTVARPALGDAAKVQLYVMGQGKGVGAQDGGGVIHQREQTVQFFLLRYLIGSGGKAPGPHHGVDGGIKSAIRLPGQDQSLLQQGGQFGGEVAGLCGAVVDVIHFAGLICDGQQLF